jgi:serine/threonine protein kinase
VNPITTEAGQDATQTIQDLGEVPKIGNKKRVEYMNKLKEDLDDKIKQRYAYTNLQQKNPTLSQSNNNLILIDHNSAYNPSQVGDAEEGNSQSENRVHNYMFGRQIGEGAYAVVRVATSRENNRKYAIKVYDKTKLSDINR